MRIPLLLALLVAVPACTQPVEEADDTAGTPAQPAEQADYLPEPHEPPEGYCQAFSVRYDVYSPLEHELDLAYCYDWADILAWQYVVNHGGISCGQSRHLPATYTNQTFHCGTGWYVWVPY
jgi:hypothetical protein